jgi:hypothetical protein
MIGLADAIAAKLRIPQAAATAEARRIERELTDVFLLRARRRIYACPGDLSVPARLTAWLF